MKVVFMGTMNFAVPILEGLIDSYDVTMVVTQPDRPFGRKKELKPSAVKLKALENKIEVYQPESIRKEYQPIIDQNPDIIIVAAYGQMIPSIILEFPKYKCINVHASLLPKLRGGAPMHKAISQGFKETGVTIMYMANKMDSGEILSQESIPILDTDDVGILEEKLSVVGKNLLLKTLPLVFSNTIQSVPQDETQVTFAYNIKREEEHLDFTGTARDVFNHVRGFHPWPLTYFQIDDTFVKVYETKIIDELKQTNTKPGEIIEVTKKSCWIQTGKGILSLEKIQIQGKKALNIVSFLAGDQMNLFSKGKILK